VARDTQLSQAEVFLCRTNKSTCWVSLEAMPLMVSLFIANGRRCLED
jgi:hypothetical protein